MKHLGLLLASALCLPAGVRAQTADYGALEELFGEPVTTSATGLPQRATDVPADMTIVTAEDIRRSGARDIPGILKHVAGIDIFQWMNDNADVSIRGYNQAFSPRLLVLVDGRQVYADYYGFTPWSTIPVELQAIRQIEIVKGPNSALFGFNAVGGVVNIVTYNPIYDDTDAASLTLGTQELGQASVVSTMKFDRGALRLSLGARSNDDFSTPIPGFIPGLFAPREQHGRIAAAVNGIIALSDKTHVTLEVTHSEADYDMLTPLYFYSHDFFRVSSARLRLDAETPFGFLKASAHTNWLNETSRSGVFGDLHLRNRVSVVQVEDLFRAGADHTFRIAGEYRYNTGDTTPFPGGSVFYDVYALSGMWDWRLSDVISLTNAVRWDRLVLGREGAVPSDYPFTDADWDRTIDSFSFNSGLVWRASESDTVRLMVSRGIQLPHLSEMGMFLASTPFARFSGTPSLDPTVIMHYQVSWDRTFVPLNAMLRASLFHDDTTSIVALVGSLVPSPAGPPPYGGPAEIGDSSATGVELELSGTFAENWRWGANYRIEWVEDDFLPIAANAATFADNEHVTPRHLVKGNIGWSNDQWEADAYLFYQSPTDGIRFQPNFSGTLVPVPGYVSVDARVAYRLTDHMTVAVSGTNLLTDTQQQHSGPNAERTVLATLALDF